MLRKIKVRWWLIAIVLLATGWTSHSKQDLWLAPSIATDKYSVVVTNIPIPGRAVWDVTIADFDGDGDEDFLMSGHSIKEKDRIYYYDGTTYVPGDFEFPSSRDRHGCTAGRFNGDTLLDIYCTAGADKGSGRNKNQLFLADPGAPGQYQRTTTPFGAEDPFGRGRLATFLNAGDQSESETDVDDLFVTVWGKRDDDKRNASDLYRNVSGKVEAQNLTMFERMGGRCLVAEDINGDKIDDLVLCHENKGASYFASTGNESYRPQVLPFADKWWPALAQGLTQDSVAALVLDDKGGSLQLYSDEPGSSLALTGRIPLRLLPTSLARRCLPHSLAVLPQESAIRQPAVFVSRVQFDKKGQRCDGVPNIILVGAKLEHYVVVPPSESNNAVRVFALNGGFLRLTATPSQHGTLEHIQLATQMD